MIVGKDVSAPDSGCTRLLTKSFQHSKRSGGLWRQNPACRFEQLCPGLQYTCSMIRQIAPVFFTTDIPATIAYYKDKLSFECLGTWQDPPVVRHCGARPARDSFPLRNSAQSQFGQIRGRTARRIPLCRRCRRALCRVCRQGRGVHAKTWRHAMALARVCSEGLRRPSAGLRRKLVVGFLGLVQKIDCADHKVRRISFVA